MSAAASSADSVCGSVPPTSSIGRMGIRTRRPLDADAQFPDRHQRLPVQVHRLQQHLPDGRHPSHHTRLAPGPQPFYRSRPARIGSAFVDRGRCLPWAMDTPCIVCQENCPVSPKAITTRTVFHRWPPQGSCSWPMPTLRRSVSGRPNCRRSIRHRRFYCRIPEDNASGPRRIVKNTDREVTLSAEQPLTRPPAPGARADVLIRLQQPCVRPEHCIGCGVCEHECPVRGRRAIRVSAEMKPQPRPRHDAEVMASS